MSDEFYRIKRLPPYVIAEVNAMRHAARRAGRDIIDLGMGNPDHPPTANPTGSEQSGWSTAIRMSDPSRIDPLGTPIGVAD